MSKRRKAQKAARLLAEAELRASNGRATVKDVDFLQRMREINGGRDPYTGVTLSSQSLSSQSTHSTPNDNGKGSQGSMFHTHTYKPTNLPLISNRGISNRGEDGVFHCAENNELTKECPIAAVPEIFFNNRQWDILLHCTEEYDTEWIALLIGALETVEGKPTYVIKDFYFPPQTASGAHVDVPVEVRPKPGVIGAIHSHVGMGVFWSATDTSHSNWPVEVVINRKREYKALARHKLKCGEWAKNDAKVFVTGSILPATVKAELDLAFVQGKAMGDKVATKKGKVTVTVPAGVAKEDEAEVSEAIVKTSTSSTPTTPTTSLSANLQLCQCGHTEIRHSQGSRTLCLDRECNCTEFKAIFHDKGENEEPCPEKECGREKGHPGWHRDKSGCHFMTAEECAALKGKGDGKGDKVDTDTAEDDTFPTGASSEGKGSTQTEAFLSDSLVANSPDIPDDLEEGDYCSTCHSTGFDSFMDRGREITIVCRACQGSGLSTSGMIKLQKGTYPLET